MSMIQTFPTAWIGQAVSIAWPAPSPDFSTVDSFVLGLSVLPPPSLHDDELQGKVVAVSIMDGT
jgi:hypothetical protein